jgi:hypothetical protein
MCLEYKTENAEERDNPCKSLKIRLFCMRKMRNFPFFQTSYSSAKHKIVLLRIRFEAAATLILSQHLAVSRWIVVNIRLPDAPLAADALASAASSSRRCREPLGRNFRPFRLTHWATHRPAGIGVPAESPDRRGASIVKPGAQDHRASRRSKRVTGKEVLAGPKRPPFRALDHDDGDLAQRSPKVLPVVRGIRATIESLSHPQPLPNNTFDEADL